MSTDELTLHDARRWAKRRANETGVPQLIWTDERGRFYVRPSPDRGPLGGRILEEHEARNPRNLALMIGGCARLKRQPIHETFWEIVDAIEPEWGRKVGLYEARRWWDTYGARSEDRGDYPDTTGATRLARRAFPRDVHVTLADRWDEPEGGAE